MITNCRFALIGLPVLFTAFAVPGVEWTGYTRAGMGGAVAGGSQLCLGAVRELGRLGNECDHYLESGLSEEVAVSATQSWRAKVSLGYAGQGNEWDDEVTLKEAYGEGRGLFSGSGAIVWAGQRFYQRHDIHHLDFFYWDISNPGAGVENIAVGKSEFAVAWFQTHRSEATIDGDSAPLINLFDVRLNDLQLADGLALDLGVIYARPSFKEASSGASDLFADGVLLTSELTWNVNKNSRNLSVLQWGNGGYAHALRYEGGGQWYALENSGHSALGWRFINWGEWQATPTFTLAHAIWGARYQRTDFATAHWAASATARPMYQLTEHLRFYAEAGYFRADDGDWGQTEQAKLTLALAIAPTHDYLSRPELRLFVSRFKDFRDPDRFASGDAACSVGVQMEAWW